MATATELHSPASPELTRQLWACLTCPRCGSGLLRLTEGSQVGFCCTACLDHYGEDRGILDLTPQQTGQTFRVESEQWDGQAERYDERRRADPVYMAGVQAAVRALELSPGLRILDAGCGTGLATEMLTTRGAVVAAVDASLASLVVLKRKPQADVVLAVRGDITQLPFASTTFDLVLCANVLQQFSDGGDRVRAVRELARVTRPGGRIVVTAHLYSVRKRWAGWLRSGSAGSHSGPVRFVHRFGLGEFRRLLRTSLQVERVTGASFPLPYRFKLTAVAKLVEAFLSRTPFAAGFGDMLVGQCRRSA